MSDAKDRTVVERVQLHMSGTTQECRTAKRMNVLNYVYLVIEGEYHTHQVLIKKCCLVVLPFGKYVMLM